MITGDVGLARSDPSGAREQRTAMNHEQFQDMLDKLVVQSGVGQEVLGEVLATRPPAAPSTSAPSRKEPSARR